MVYSLHGGHGIFSTWWTWYILYMVDMVYSLHGGHGIFSTCHLREMDRLPKPTIIVQGQRLAPNACNLAPSGRARLVAILLDGACACSCPRSQALLGEDCSISRISCHVGAPVQGIPPLSNDLPETSPAARQRVAPAAAAAASSSSSSSSSSPPPFPPRPSHATAITSAGSSTAASASELTSSSSSGQYPMA